MSTQEEFQAAIALEMDRRDAAHRQELAALRTELSNAHAQAQLSIRGSYTAPIVKFSAPEFFGHGESGKIEGKEGPREWLRSFQGAVLLFEARNETQMSETVKKLEVRQHLKGSAGNWFETYESKYSTWDAFVIAFSAYYGLENLQIRLRLELFKLKQGPNEDIRMYNNRYQHLHQQIVDRNTKDAIFNYIQGLGAKARQHMYVTHPYNAWECLEKVMESALSYSLAGINAVTTTSSNADVEMNATGLSIDRKKKKFKWSKEEWARIKNESRCHKCGGLGHLSGTCTADADVKLLLHEVQQPADNVELGYMSSEARFTQAMTAPVRFQGSRVVRVVEQGKRNEPHVRFEPGRVHVENDGIQYPASYNSAEMVNDDQEICYPSEDEVDYECGDDVEGSETVECCSMTLDSMDKPFVGNIDDMDCYLWSGLSFTPFEINVTQTKISKSQHSQLMKINVNLGGVGALALIDSGASHRFVKRSWLQTHGIRGGIQGSRQVVKQANGTFETLGKIDLKLSIEGRVDESSYYVLPDGSGHDIVLGMSWLSAHNPLINWRDCSLSFPNASSVNYNVELSAQQVLNNPSIESTRLSARDFRRTLDKDAQLYCIDLNDTSDVSLNNLEEIKTLAMNPKLAAVVKKYQDRIVDDIPGVAPATNSLPRHHIDWKGTKPPSRPLIRLSYKELDHLKEKLDEFLAKGWIQPSKSPFGAPVLLVAKKEAGKLRMCIDYRQLNAGTTVSQYPLPHTDELFNRLRGAKVFSKIDLHSGFYQILMAVNDIPKTAFRTRYGHFEWRVMPMGLAGAPATFQTVMNDLFRTLLDVCVIVFLDDILVYSKDDDDHALHLEAVLTILKDNGLYAAKKKCQFGVNRIEFLGHIVTPDGLS